VKFPHLMWAISNWGPQYRLAQSISRSEARLSRCLSGRTNFTAEERAALSRVLGYSEPWLFEEATPEYSQRELS
jgi:plasmid maintenance system antidote protein VapI